MPVHDMNIGNDSGANVRTDLNNALAALVQNFSNAGTPATTFAHMIFADTTPAGYSIFTVRDAADAVEATLFDDEGRWKGADGTAAQPSISFGSDTDTGWYRVGVNDIGLSVAGTKVFGINANGFRYRGVQPHLILVETDQVAGEEKWGFQCKGSGFRLVAFDNAETTLSSALTITRTAAVVTSLRLDNRVGVGVGLLGTNTNDGDMTLAGALGLTEMSAPTADTAVGKLYTTTDNALFFQSGSGGAIPDSVISPLATTITTDTTPTAEARRVIIIGTWTAANNITDFDNETAGQRLTILGGDGDCNVVDGAPIQLVGGVTWNGAAGATLDLVSDGTVWYERGRSDAS